MDIEHMIKSIIIVAIIVVILAIRLTQYIQSKKDINHYNHLAKIIMNLLLTAEEEFDNGKDRKEYVMNNVKSLNKIFGHNLDLDQISKMIDSIVDVTKKINTK